MTKSKDQLMFRNNHIAIPCSKSMSLHKKKYEIYINVLKIKYPIIYYVKTDLKLIFYLSLYLNALIVSNELMVFR